MRKTCPQCSKTFYGPCHNEDCPLCADCCQCPPLTDDEAEKPIRWLWPQTEHKWPQA